MQLRAAVLGSPIAHSLSPVLHRAGYAALGLTDWTYGAHDVQAAALAGFVAGLDDVAWRGLSLTMPLKEAAFDVAATVSDVARAAGAVNTLVRRADGRWDADNTDVHGLAAALAGVGHDGTATVLGAGATTRSALLALHRLGVTRVRVAARRPESVVAFTQWAETLPDAPAVVGCDLADWAAEPTRLVVSTLPPGPSPAVAERLRLRRWQDATLLDVVYEGWPTPLARAACAEGLRVVSGVDMLVHQGAAQFRLFTGHDAPVDVMLEAVRAYR